MSWRSDMPDRAKPAAPRLAGVWFVVFAPNAWHDIWRNRQQIFSRLAGSNQVLYVEPARVALRDWRLRRVSWAEARRPALIREQPNLWLYRSPAWTPVRGTADRFDQASDQVLAWHLRRTIKRLGQAETVPETGSHGEATLPSSDSQLPREKPAPAPQVLWLYRPNNWRWAASTVRHDLLVYHITDDYAAFSHLDEAQRQALLQAERELLATADLTIVTAPRLLELKQPLARRIALVPNGVDYAAYQAAAANPAPPVALQQLPSPVLGYSGHISARLDLTLLRDLARARPNWQFAFAGSMWEAGCQDKLAALQEEANVHLLGRLPVDQVPSFIAGCDVCLIPYQVTDETRAVSSLKLYEYLAAGKPVVSAAVPAAQEHAQVVRIAAATTQAWIREIEGALGEATEASGIAARQAVAAANTWDERVARIEALVAQLLAS